MSLDEALALRAQCEYRRALIALADAESGPALAERSRLHEAFGDYDAAWPGSERQRLAAKTNEDSAEDA